MHGIARVLVKGYGERRISELSRRREFTPARANDGSWVKALMRDLAEAGVGGMVVRQGSPDGPIH